MGKSVNFSNKEKDEEIEVIFTLEFTHNMIALQNNIDSYPPEIREILVHAIHDLVETKFVSFLTKFKINADKAVMKIDDIYPVDKEEYAEIMETAPNSIDIDELKCEYCEEKDSCKKNKIKNKNETQRKLNEHKKKELKNKLKDFPQMIISTDNTIN
jgi:hypothetical protein